MKLLRGDLAKSASEIKTEMENIKILKEKQEKENKLFKKEIQTLHEGQESTRKMNEMAVKSIERENRNKNLVEMEGIQKKD